MNKVYGVFHLYDEDGGFGDAIRQRQRFKLLATDERLHHVSDG